MSVEELKTDNVQVVALVTEVFRALRNSCVGEPANQIVIAIDTAAIDYTCNVVRLILHSPGQDNVLCLRVGVQFLGNLIVNNRETQPIIWNKCCQILL